MKYLEYIVLCLVYLSFPLLMSAFIFDMPLWLAKSFVFYSVIAMILCPLANSIVIDNKEKRNEN
jgi:hypothetical protein